MLHASTAQDACTAAFGQRGGVAAGAQDIAAEFWVGSKPSRPRKQRLMTVAGHQVLRENNYDLASVRTLLP